MEFLARALRQEKERKRIQIGKEELKLSLFAGNMVLYLKDPKDSNNNNKKLLSLINTFRYVAVYKIIIQKSVPLLCTNNRLRKKSGKQFHPQ
jgi:methyl coenzyme M reductase subunit D